MKPTTFLILSALLIVSSFSNVSMAQVKDSSEVKTNLPGNTFYFYFINGYALACKFYNSANSSLRLRIDLSSSYSDTKSNQDDYLSSAPDKRANEYNVTNSINNITTEFAYSYNFYRSRLSHAYAGAGPFVSYSRTKEETLGKDTYPPNSGYSRTISHLDHAFSAGLSAFIGLEAFLTQSLSIVAETQLTGGRSWSKSEADYEYLSQPDAVRSTSGNNVTDSSWFYNFTSVRIGIGISI